MFRGALQPWHLIILVLVVVIVFGWKRLPDAARSVGRSARILKSEVDEMKAESGSSASKQTVNSEAVPPQQQQGYPQQNVPPQQGYPQPNAAPQQGYPQQDQGQQQGYPQQGGYPQGQPQAGHPEGYPQRTDQNPPA